MIMKREAIISSGEVGAKQAQDLRAVNSVKSGDTGAFEFLYSKYGRYIRQYCYMSFGNTRTAEDLVQEIMSKIYLNIDKYTEDCTFNSWVWKIVRNHVVDYSRKQRRVVLSTSLNYGFSSEFSEDVGDECCELGTTSIWTIDSGVLNPEEEYVLKQKKACVRKMLSLVSEREKRVLEMFYFEDKTYKEISKELNIGMSLTQTSILRAKEKIRNHMVKKGFMTSLAVS